jgi:hypothetical protein
LGVLEDCLRSVSTEIVREGRRITFFGLGPSPRAINRRDTTVIDVDAEDGVTTIGADVSFQASAFLGNAPQDVVVQEKLDRVFDQMRIQLGLDPWAASSHPEPAISNGPVGAASPEAPLEVPPPEDIEPAEEIVVPPMVQPDAPSSTSSTLLSEQSPESREQPPVEAVPVTEVVILTTDPEAEPAAANTKPEPEATVPEPARSASAIGYESATKKLRRIEPPAAEVVTRWQSSISAQRESRSATATMLEEEPLETAVTAPRLLLDESVSDEKDESKSRLLQWSAWAAAVVVLVLAPAAWLFLPRHLETRTPAPQAQQAPVPVSPQASVSPVPSAPPAPPAPKEPGLSDDPAAVVQEWEVAMGSRDAAAQAAFYADPVERYFLRHNVSKDQVVADKQAAIDGRHGTWVVKMERVKVTRPDEAIAKVRLIKHFTVRQDGRLTSEWFIPSQLQLNRLEGKWRITSERDLGWATSMDELDD